MLIEEREKRIDNPPPQSSPNLELLRGTTINQNKHRTIEDYNLHPEHPFRTKTHFLQDVSQVIPSNTIIGLLEIHPYQQALFFVSKRIINYFINIHNTIMNVSLSQKDRPITRNKIRHNSTRWISNRLV